MSIDPAISGLCYNCRKLIDGSCSLGQMPDGEKKESCSEWRLYEISFAEDVYLKTFEASTG